MSPNRKTVVLSLAVIAFMVSLVAVSVPLYSLFCRVTGYNGTPRQAAGPSPATGQRVITIRFDASVARGMPWRFVPERNSLQARLGETELAVFTAENPTDEAMTGTAAFNVTPAKAGPYVNKIACFCFTEQHLAAHEKVAMPVSFFVDPRIALDPDTDDVGTITLSYTFFKTPAKAGRTEGPS